MATSKERDRFIIELTKALSATPADKVEHAARLILRHAKTHGRLAEESCNGHPAQGSPTMPTDQLNRLQERWDARIEKQEAQIERRIKEICEPLGIVPDFGGDPRGYTVRLHLPTGAYNTWGGRESGFGVPQ